MEESIIAHEHCVHREETIPLKREGKWKVRRLFWTTPLLCAAICARNVHADTITFSSLNIASGTAVEDFSLDIGHSSFSIGTTNATLATKLLELSETGKHIAVVTLDFFNGDSLLVATDKFEDDVVTGHAELDGVSDFDVSFGKVEETKITSTVPEPSSVLLLAAGLLCAVAMRGLKGA